MRWADKNSYLKVIASSVLVDLLLFSYTRFALDHERERKWRAINSALLFLFRVLASFVFAFLIAKLYLNRR